MDDLTIRPAVATADKDPEVARPVPKNPDSNGGLTAGTAGLPVWARVLSLVGIPGFLLLILVWVGANDIPRISRAVDAMHQSVLINGRTIEETRGLMDRNFRLNQRICAGLFEKNPDQLRRCFD